MKRDATLGAEWAQGATFGEFVEAATRNVELWQALYDRARVPDAIRARVEAAGPLNLLVIADDWCGDAVNTIPLLARLVHETDGAELRIVGRDEFPALMDAHLTGTSRSIPVVLLLDEDYRELDWWGPRPAPLQAWVLESGLQLPSAERYRHVRAWYARDRGVTTLHEIVDLVERPRLAAAS